MINVISFKRRNVTNCSVSYIYLITFSEVSIDQWLLVTRLKDHYKTLMVRIIFKSLNCLSVIS